jgi:hypothetical protein
VKAHRVTTVFIQGDGMRGVAYRRRNPEIILAVVAVQVAQMRDGSSGPPLGEQVIPLCNSYGFAAVMKVNCFALAIPNACLL